MRAWALYLVVSILGCVEPPPAAPPVAEPGAVVARISLREPLAHRWVDELVHLDVELDRDSARGPLHLDDGSGAPVPVEIELGSTAGDRVRASVSTVVTLAPDAERTLVLRAGAAIAPGSVSVRREPGRVVLANDRFEIAIPTWSEPPGDRDLGAMPPPIAAVRRAGGAWMGEGAWISAGPGLHVRHAETTIVAEGPVRAAVRKTLRFADGRVYEVAIALGAKQDAAIVTEDSDEAAPSVAHRISLPGRVVWRNQWKATEGAGIWEIIDDAVDRDRALFALRPWSFWWLSRLNAWATFGPPGGDTMVGVLAIKPSRWSPTQWSGFERTAIPVVARGGHAEVSFPLAASDKERLHRLWAISALPPPRDDTAKARAAVARAALVKLSEFPLDEVLRMNLDAKLAPRAHPSLLFDAADIARARRQAGTSPALRARKRAAVAYLDRCSDMEPELQKGGPAALYKAYAHHALYETLPEAWLVSDDPRYGRWLAASVDGLARRVVQFFVTAPERPSLGANGPWYSEEVTRLAIAWDLVGDRLPPDRAAFVRRAMIFGAHVLDHPDYWNLPRGLASANPNMTSAMALPRGLLGIELLGHPEAERWVRAAEAELTSEIEGWVSPGGAWIEAPGYQAASLDAMFLLGAALRRAGRGDAFSHPSLKATMDYSGFLLTAPDRRFARPPLMPVGDPAPMVQPSIGNTFSGWVTPFHGWMAAATARTDPAFSARQQFFWKRQGSMHGNAGRAKGLVPALVDPDLPERPPEETSRAFPGFGAVMRSSWTDPRQSYVALRTGPNEHHYSGGEHGSIVYYAKGAPLCLDWGNIYKPMTRGEAWYHNTVSFERRGPTIGMTGAVGAVRSLPGFVESTHGTSRGGGNQESRREILMIESADPMGANYLVMRDSTRDGQRGQRFYFNLFCLSRAPEIKPGFAHFPGQMGVDLDVFFLSPKGAPLSTDHWAWREPIYTWGTFSEEQHGIFAMKEGSREDFFTVLYPRAGGERAPRARAIAGGAAAVVTHGEGRDLVLLSPGRPTSAEDGGAKATGEIAFARRSTNGKLRLVVVSGDASAEVAGWGLASRGPAAMEVAGGAAHGVSDGPLHEVRVTSPRGLARAVVRVDGRVVEAAREGRAIVIALPAGRHRFAIDPR